MAVHLTRIYTRTGDDGTTGLSDFSRVSKNDPRLVAYADCDETNAAIGVALALGALPERLVPVLRQIQNDLFDAGADLSTPVVENPKYPPLRITQQYIDRLEGWCDEFNEELEPLNSFILPGGTPGAALLHTARTVARRAERSAWAAVDAAPDDTNVLPAKYLNRLSDLLFILCRIANPDGDVLWKRERAREEVPLDGAAALRPAVGPGFDPGHEGHQSAAVERDLVRVVAVDHIEDHDVLGHDVEFAAFRLAPRTYIDALTGQAYVGSGPKARKLEESECVVAVPNDSVPPAGTLVLRHHSQDGGGTPAAQGEETVQQSRDGDREQHHKDIENQKSR